RDFVAAEAAARLLFESRAADTSRTACEICSTQCRRICKPEDLCSTWRYDLGTGDVGGIPVTYPKDRDVVKLHENTSSDFSSGRSKGAPNSSREGCPAMAGARVCVIATSVVERSVIIRVTGL